MSIPFLALLLLASAFVGWHARDRIDTPPGWDETAARRLARRFWKRRRKS